MVLSDFSSSVGFKDSAETLPLLFRLKLTPIWIGAGCFCGFGGSDGNETFRSIDNI